MAELFCTLCGNSWEPSHSEGVWVCPKCEIGAAEYIFTSATQADFNIMIEKLLAVPPVAFNFERVRNEHAVYAHFVNDSEFIRTIDTLTVLFDRIYLVPPDGVLRPENSPRERIVRRKFKALLDAGVLIPVFYDMNHSPVGFYGRAYQDSLIDRGSPFIGVKAPPFSESPIHLPHLLEDFAKLMTFADLQERPRKDLVSLVRTTLSDKFPAIYNWSHPGIEMNVLNKMNGHALLSDWLGTSLSPDQFGSPVVKWKFSDLTDGRVSTHLSMLAEFAKQEELLLPTNTEDVLRLR